AKTQKSRIPKILGSCRFSLYRFFHCFLLLLSLGTCGPLPRLTYAAPREDYSNRTSFPWGTTVEYTCRPGYTKRSASFLHCDRLSRWTCSAISLMGFDHEKGLFLC
uniref:Sushi domain-containing protein n=1 Tax=Crocodylus porosus TaxID=8502 RepID=A0A7M4DV54_CROPO